MVKLIERGRLWQLDSRFSLEENVRQALEYYASRHGEAFTVVAANLEAEEASVLEPFGLKVVLEREVLANCLFFSLDGDSKQE